MVVRDKEGPAARALEVLEWGRLDYNEALRRQLALVSERAANVAPDRLIFVEHDPVVTIGRSGGRTDLCIPEAEIRGRGVDVHESDRGGMATCHAPGQMVAYPIIKLKKKDLHEYLQTFLDAAVSVLHSFGLSPELKPGEPGVWVNGGKIASVGIAVRSWVTYHGMALNVNNDVSQFNLIVPCGIPGQKITSLSEELSAPVNMERVKEEFEKAFRRNFGYPERTGFEKGDRLQPPWLVKSGANQEAVETMEGMLADMRLTTVCQNAHCPNLGECFNQGAATFMILGDCCTRNCRFCAVNHGRPVEVDPNEPERVALAAKKLNLDYVVVTSVTRDDLEDGGAAHFAATIESIRNHCPGSGVEVLIPDFQGAVSALDTVIDARPDVLNHNIETVQRLYRQVRPGAEYKRSLQVMEYASSRGVTVKSGLMLGLGETGDEIAEALEHLRKAGCSLITIGQYLPPSKKHHPLDRYVSPDEFEKWADEALKAGFTAAASSPLVRSSYRAGEMYLEVLKKRGGES